MPPLSRLWPIAALMTAVLCTPAQADEAWSVGLGASLAQGNAAALGANGFLDSRLGWGRHGVDMGAAGQLGFAVSDDNETGTVADDSGYARTEQAFASDVAYAYQINDRYDGIAGLGLEHRPMSGILGRPELTAGARYNLVPPTQRVATVSAGMLGAVDLYTEVAADLNGSLAGTVVGPFIGHSLRLPVGDRATYLHDLRIVENLLDLEDFRLDAASRIAAPISDAASLQLGLELRLDTQPVADPFDAADLSSNVQFVYSN